MIVVDASALLEALLRTPAARAVESWLFESGQTLHVPHLLDLEVAQVLRRYAANGEIDVERGHAALARSRSCCCNRASRTGRTRMNADPMLDPDRANVHAVALASGK